MVLGPKTSITATLKAYNDALVDSNTASVTKHCANTAVIMPQNFPASVGADAIRDWYNNVFAATQLTVVFDILEVVVASEDWAFARTSSHGTQRNLKNGSESKEGNSELFVLKSVDGEWKIARYCFCTTNPAK
ncbi:hypothetical protein H2203_003524 [Taxawa tesnikishii (nom. ined.)]|nr:hypothetical protein H2203_003524 [Dothideales sp. JES 119]